MIDRAISVYTEVEAKEIIAILEWYGIKYNVGRGFGKIFIMVNKEGKAL